MKIQKITPFLWYDNNAQDAVKFYATVFKNSKIIGLSPLVCTFELEGLQLMAINGGPQFKLSEAFSLFISCDNQEEVDELWEKLSEGGEKSMCGWLKDKFGLSWQVIPRVLIEYMSDSDPVKAQRVMQAMLQMRKINIQQLTDAYEGK